jgi:transcription elongation GreA/GreB family factor
MNKEALIKKIVARLREELEAYFNAARTAHEEATHEQSKAENKYDTRGLEASYLAHGQSRQAAELEAAIATFEQMDGHLFGKKEPIGVGALVELEHDGGHTLYFVASRAGGMDIMHEKREVLVITPQSPMGGQLQGKREGDLQQLGIGGTRNKYRVARVL